MTSRVLQSPSKGRLAACRVACGSLATYPHQFLQGGSTARSCWLMDAVPSIVSKLARAAATPTSRIGVFRVAQRSSSQGFVITDATAEVGTRLLSGARR